MENHPDEMPLTPPANGQGHPDQPEFTLLESAGWEQICEILRRKLGEDNFSRCFSGTRARIEDGQRLLLSVPNPIHQVWIESNFSGTFADAVAEVLGAAATIEYEIASEPLRPLPANASVEKKAARALLTRNTPEERASPHVSDDSLSIRSFADAGPYASISAVSGHGQHPHPNPTPKERTVSQSAA